MDGVVQVPKFARYLSVGKQPGHLGHRVGGTAQRPEPFPHQQLRPATLPLHPRLQFGRFYRRRLPCAADYHDVIGLGGNRFAITMADIAGPGAQAAAAMIGAAIRGHAGRHDDSGSLLHHISEQFRYLWQATLEATALCAVIDIRRRTLRLASAGHPSPLLAREGTAVMPLPAHGSKRLGDTALILSSEFDLRSGDRLLFYTTGVTGGDKGAGVPYGLDGLTSALQKVEGFPPALAVECLGHDLECAGSGSEDQTLLMVGIG